VTVWNEIVAELGGLAGRTVHNVSPPPRRFKVRNADPLVVEELHGDLVLEEGDPDFEVEEALKTTRPAAGDLVLVDTDAHGDYVARGRIADG
jgi:hypothetical protein